MNRFKQVARCVGAFALIYGALIAPWPGWNALYGKWFRFYNGELLPARIGSKTVRIQEAGPGGRLDTQIVLIDPIVPALHGRVSAGVLGLDTRGVGWIPTAFLCALVLSTPVPWKRRLTALGLGLLAVHFYLTLSLRAYIWNESVPAVGEAGSMASHFLKWLAGCLEETLITQLGPSFVIPAIIWLLVTLRREDLDRIQEMTGIRRDRR
jgi:hypothetical protein